MASFSFARQSQPTAAQPRSGSALSSGASRTTNGTSPSDPLQPLRAMADRVGKEVEKFAERVDHWHTHGNDSRRAKYQTTVKMVGKFRDLAESQVKELKKVNDAENKGDLTKSVRRRIQNMAEAPDNSAQGGFAQSLQSLAPSSDSGATSDSANLRELRQWQAELATWELVRLIIEQYHPEPGTDVAAEKKERLAKAGGTARYCKNSEIWDRFLLEDDQAREKAIVLRWLEQTAHNSESDIESITAELEAASGKGAHTWTSGWLDTKSKIKQAKRLEGTNQPLSPNAALKTADRTANLITQLDPDAATRQKRALEKPDEYYERALWMTCYEMMRRGVPWKKIVEWCHERNEAWRVVSMGAACEAHPNGGPNVAGPTVGYMFRRMCFYAARGARIPYEGAVYGLLSGDLKQVQAVCRSWDDHLYAHYNALLFSRFDSYLQQNYPNRVMESLAQKFVFQDAVANIGSWEESPQKVIDLLKQQKPTANQSVSPIKLIQSALISRSVDDLMLKVGVAIADMLQEDERPQNLIIHPDSDIADRCGKPLGEERTFTAERWYQSLASDPHAFRILVHLFIAFRNGLRILSTEESDHEKCLAVDNIVAAYIEFLRTSHRMQLIPLYAAQLVSARTAHCLARVLPDIKHGEEQRRYVALLEQYRIDLIEVVAQTFTFAFRDSGFTHFHKEGYTVITHPIKQFSILERVTGPREQILWPGVRIKKVLDGSVIEPKDEAIIEALQWYHYASKDYKQTFEHLKNAMIIFLLNGRLGAAEKVINDLSVESLSLSRTEALLGYPFDITTPGADEQNEQELNEHRDSLSTAARAAAIPQSRLPDAEEHLRIVNHLRTVSSEYYDLQQMVRLLVLFREWRDEEEALIKSVKKIKLRSERQQNQEGGPQAALKPDTKRTKELLDAITAIFDALIQSISDAPNRDMDFEESDDGWRLKKAFIPDIVMAYLSVLQSASYFLHREPAVQAMEVAVLVADPNNEWLQRVFLETGRMSELVDCLACVSKAMLRLTEHEPKKAEKKKKRGSKGETLRIWDLGARDRV